MNKKIMQLLFFVLILGNTHKVHCQDLSDTTALLNEFNKVMSFAVQPYLYYSTETKTGAYPLMNTTDTMTLHGIFYKNNTDLYYGNEAEEMYVEDSMMVKINHSRKSIWLNKIDMSTKEKMNLLPLNTVLIKKNMLQNYTIEKSQVSPAIQKLSFSPRQNNGQPSSTTILMTLEYNAQTLMPRSIQLDIRMQKEANTYLLNSLKADSIDFSGLLKTIDGVSYLVRTQKVNVTFLDINHAKEKAVLIPSFRKKIHYDKNQQEYSGKNEYEGYEIIKTF